MTAAVSLLPSNATPFEHAVSLATDVIPRVEAGVALIKGGKYGSIHQADVIPAMIAELGLGEISRFFEDPEELIQQGVRWQRIRGTPQAVDQALAWVNYQAELEEEPVRHDRWHLVQLALTRLRDAEVPDLADIAETAQLSVPLRSHVARGFHGHDVRAAELDYSILGNCILGDHSGYRFATRGVQWSFGRDHVFDLQPSQSQLTALGAWQPLAGTAISWGNFTWAETSLTWDDPAAAARRLLIIVALRSRSVWLQFSGAGGIIGLQRARVIKGVNPDIAGPYMFGGINYSESLTSPEVLLIDAITDFGSGNGETVTALDLVFDSNIVDPLTPGIDWISGADAATLLTAGTSLSLGPLPTSFELGKTVRDRCTVRLTF